MKYVKISEDIFDEFAGNMADMLEEIAKTGTISEATMTTLNLTSFVMLTTLEVIE